MSIKTAALITLLLAAAAGGGASLYYGTDLIASGPPSVPGQTSAAELQKNGREIAALPPDAVVQPDAPEQSGLGTAGSQPLPTEAGAGEFRLVAPRFDVVRVEPSGEMVLAGGAAALAAVDLMLKGTAFASTTSGKDGDWAMVPISPLPLGNHELVLRASGEDGRGGPIEGDRLVVAILANDRMPLVVVARPGEPLQVVQLPEQVGASGSDDRSKGKLRVSEQAEAIAAPAESSTDVPVFDTLFLAIDSVETEAPHHLRVTGRAEAGTTVRIYLNAAHLTDAKPSATGAWTAREEHELALGRHTVRADLIDSEGRVRARAQVQFDRLQVVLAQSMDRGGANPNNGSDSDQPHTVAIERGDNLWRIAHAIYGQGVRYSVIYDANRNQIKDPNLIFPGQVFTVPVLDEPSR